MRSLKRIFLALIAVVVFFLMNPGFLAIQAYAWETWTTQPQWDKPSWSQPGWNSPPQWSDPAWTTPPDWSDPTWKNQPQWNDPTWKSAPQWSDPAWRNSPEWSNTPWQTKPEWNTNPNSNGNGPNPNGPNGQPSNPSTAPDGTNQSNPDGKNPGPPYNPEYKNPGIDTLNKLDDQVKGPSSNQSSNANDESFFTFEDTDTKDAIKYISKDIIGETVNFTDSILRTNTTTPGDLFKHKGKMFESGFKTFVKGDPTLDAIYDSKDLIKSSKDLYDNINTFNQVRDIQKLKEAGDIITAAEQLDDLYRAGKTFTPANAVVSTLTLPFAVMDTVDNVGKFNSAKTSEEKTNAVWDLVGNGGDIITGLAPAVALIPGAQPIAAGMVVVGGVLSLASLGHKIYRNREKIVKDVKKKFNKAKEAVTGFFKSVFG